MKFKALFGLACFVILIVQFLYYPRWNKSETEATLSWDVSGYYMYLPAIFIYNDLKGCTFQNNILEKYKPTTDFQQAFKHKSGNYVMKYPIGQAMLYSPFFFIAHFWAQNSTDYLADGFSLPYQFSISMGSLLVAFIGLFFLTKILQNYFDKKVIAISIGLLLLGTNYLNYTAIDGAQTHNYLFTLYAVLIYSTIRFYKNPNRSKAAIIGFIVGVLALTRPTEIISSMIPMLWGVDVFNKHKINERYCFLRSHFPIVLLAMVICLSIGFIQLAYWKYVGDEWIIYSYQNQGFSWLRPHLYQGFFSYKAGWLIYTPMMVFSLIGFTFLSITHRHILGVCLFFFLFFVYLAFAWDIWWYGGSLGQRTMIQAYPMLLIPFSSFISWFTKLKSEKQLLISLIFSLFIFINLWWTHQAHGGGLFHAEQMTKEYYWKVLGNFDKNIEDLKLLDTDELFDGKRKNVRIIFESEMSNVQNNKCLTIEKSNGDIGHCLNANNQYSPLYDFELNVDFEWMRVGADFQIILKEWDIWKMTQFIVRLSNNGTEVKNRMIRVQRLLNDNEQNRIYFDIKNPKRPLTAAQISIWNADGNKEILIKNLTIELFDEE